MKRRMEHMWKASAFVSEKARAEKRRAGEKRWLIGCACTGFLCGAALLLVPFTGGGYAAFAASWLLLAVLALTLLRPLFYSRGVADAAMALLLSCLYALSGWVVGSGTDDIGRWWLSFSLAFFLAGISRILAYARLLPLVNLPLLLLCGAAELASGVLTFLGWPAQPLMLYWFLGMTFLLSGFEAAAEAAKLDLPPVRMQEDETGGNAGDEDASGGAAERKSGRPPAAPADAVNGADAPGKKSTASGWEKRGDRKFSA